MPIYRNKQTGHEVEVMPGTRLPKAYEKVDKRSNNSKASQTKNPQDENHDNDKPAKAAGGSKPKTSKTAAKGKPAKDGKGAVQGKDESTKPEK